jgi:hypothetical protein
MIADIWCHLATKRRPSDVPFNRFLFTSKVAAGTAGASNHRN